MLQAHSRSEGWRAPTGPQKLCYFGLHSSSLPDLQSRLNFMDALADSSGLPRPNGSRASSVLTNPTDFFVGDNAGIAEHPRAFHHPSPHSPLGVLCGDFSASLDCQTLIWFTPINIHWIVLFPLGQCSRGQLTPPAWCSSTPQLHDGRSRPQLLRSSPQRTNAVAHRSQLRVLAT